MIDLKRTSLRTRLIAIYLGLVIIGFGGLTLWAGQQIAKATMDDFGNNLQIVALSLASDLVESLEDHPEEAAPIMQSAANRLNAVVALFSPNGAFTRSTNGAELNLVQTGTYHIQENEAGEPIVYSSAEVLYEGEVLGIVQIGVSASEPRTTIRKRWLVLAGGFVAFSILGIVVSLWLLTTLIRPLTNLRETALKMADGDLSQRVTDLPHDEIGAVGNAFNVMAAKVEAMLVEQRAFASNASHELRTPLTTVRLRTEAILTEPLDEPIKQQYIGEIDSEIKRMSRLVEDLMMLSRLDAKRLSIGDEPVDVGRLLLVLQREFAPLAQEKQIDLQITLPEASLIVAANSSHLRVVYRNVLDNSLKYTPSGGRITAVLTQSGKTAVLTVTDNGEGIAAEDLPQIGNRFFRADKSHSRTIPGTGLGLAMVRSILSLYKGSMTVESEGVGLGTAVSVYWPLVEG